MSYQDQLLFSSVTDSLRLINDNLQGINDSLKIIAHYMESQYKDNLKHKEVNNEML